MVGIPLRGRVIRRQERQAACLTLLSLCSSGAGASGGVPGATFAEMQPAAAVKWRPVQCRIPGAFSARRQSAARRRALVAYSRASSAASTTCHAEWQRKPETRRRTQTRAERGSRTRASWSCGSSKLPLDRFFFCVGGVACETTTGSATSRCCCTPLVSKHSIGQEKEMGGAITTSRMGDLAAAARGGLPGAACVERPARASSGWLITLPKARDQCRRTAGFGCESSHFFPFHGFWEIARWAVGRTERTRTQKTVDFFFGEA